MSWEARARANHVFPPKRACALAVKHAQVRAKALRKLCKHAMADVFHTCAHKCLQVTLVSISPKLICSSATQNHIQKAEGAYMRKAGISKRILNSSVACIDKRSPHSNEHRTNAQNDL